jgi:hypothetical protein
VQDEQIAVVKQVGRRFVAYLLGYPQIRSEGSTELAALESLADAAHCHQKRCRSTPPLVQKVIIQANPLDR